MTTGQLVEALSRSIPAQRLVTDRDVVASLSADDAEWAPVGEAALAMRARSEAEVQDAVRVCADLNVPIVPRGRGPVFPVAPTPSTGASSSTSPR